MVCDDCISDFPEPLTDFNGWVREVLSSESNVFFFYCLFACLSGIFVEGAVHEYMFCIEVFFTFAQALFFSVFIVFSFCSDSTDSALFFSVFVVNFECLYI